MVHLSCHYRYVHRSTSKPVSGFVKSEPTGLSGMELNLTGQPLWDFEEPLKRTSCSCTSSSNISRYNISKLSGEQLALLATS